MKKLIITNILGHEARFNPFFYFNDTVEVNGINLPLNPFTDELKGDDTIFNDSVLRKLFDIYNNLIYTKNIDQDDSTKTLKMFEDLLKEGHEYVIQSFNNLPFLNDSAKIIQLAEKYNYEVYFFKFNHYIVLYDYIRNTDSPHFISDTLDDYFKINFQSITSNIIECDNILKTLDDIKHVISFNKSSPKRKVEDYFPKQQLDCKNYSFAELETLYAV